MHASAIDRLAVCQRPRGWPVMYQTWDKLLFMHWPVPPERLRPLIPRRLAIDTFEGSAWVGVTPFTIRGIRPPFVPPLPFLSQSHELNVRTYVHVGGVPGVWFFSLDAANALAVLGARLSYFLPYYRASMSLEQQWNTIHFRSRRTHAGAATAELEATWSVGERLPEAQCGSRDFFLIERYCLYAARRERLYRARIHHRPWPLAEANLSSLSSTMLQSHGLVGVNGNPLVHALAQPLLVEVWPPRRVDAGRSGGARRPRGASCPP